MISNNNNNSHDANRDPSKYVKVSKSGVFIAFKTVNDDWCVINTKMDIHNGAYIVEKEPFASCRAMLMHLSDFDNWLPGLNEIPVTTKWPLPQYNNSSRSN